MLVETVPNPSVSAKADGSKAKALSDQGFLLFVRGKLAVCYVRFKRYGPGYLQGSGDAGLCVGSIFKIV